MKKYNKFDIDRVKSAADIRDFILGAEQPNIASAPSAISRDGTRGFVSRIKPIWILRNASRAGSL